MGMVVRSNIMAVNANRQLGMNNSQVSKSLEKLASGFKINRAGDDASGLAISEKMKAQIKGLETASANSQDGVSLIQTAEGALTEVHDMLNRMVELAGKSANGTMDTTVDRAALQKEFNSLIDEIDRVASSTNFNGIKLLDGSLSAGGVAGGNAGAGALTAPKIDGGKLAGADLTKAQLDAANTQVDATKAVGTAGTAVAAASATDPYTLTVTITAQDGTESLVKVEYTGGADADATANNIKDALSAKKEISDLYDVTVSGGKLVFTSKAAGSKAGPEVTKIESTDTVAVGAGVTTADGADAHTTGLDMSGVTSGDEITIGGKTYQFLADPTAADAGKIGVGLGVDADAAIANLKTELEKNGVTIQTATNNAVTFAAKKADDAGDNTAAPTGGLQLQIGDTAETFNRVTVSVEDMSTTGLGINQLKVATDATTGGVMSQVDAQNAINLLRGDLASGGTTRGAINLVSDARADLGALQNRLEHTINNLDVAAENMTAANSRIRDTDMAKQMMEYTKQNVLTQAAQAMLAQANQQPQSVLQLLQ